MQKILTWGSVALGVIFIIIAVVYFITPSGHLPTIMPGYIPDGTNIHYKHGIAALILGLGLFAFAWFQGAPTYAPAVASENADDSQ